MIYKTIAVCMSNKADAERLIPAASIIARKFNAHLLGLFSLQTMEIYSGISMHLSGAAIDEMKRIQGEHATEVKAVFDNLTKNEDFVSEWRTIETTTAATGENLAREARSADLVIMNQVDPEDSHPGAAQIQRHVIEHSGRPVLVVPRFIPIEDIGNKILIGWSGTGECARAVHDAIPFCQASESTSLFWVIGDDKVLAGRLEQSGRDIANVLARHNVTTSVSSRVKTDIPIGDELLNEAADTGADMIVIGAFGHSRLYDFVIGATTSHLLRFMTTPVLFSN